MLNPQRRSIPTRAEGKKAFRAHRFNIFLRSRQAKLTGSSEVSVQTRSQPGDPGGQTRPERGGGCQSTPVPSGDVQACRFRPVIIGQRYSLSTPTTLEFQQPLLFRRNPAQIKATSGGNSVLNCSPDQQVIGAVLQLGWIGCPKSVDPGPRSLPDGDGCGRDFRCRECEIHRA